MSTASIGIERKRMDLSARYDRDSKAKARFYSDEIGMKPSVAEEFAHRFVLTDLVFNVRNIREAIKEEWEGDSRNMVWILKNGETLNTDRSAYDTIRDAVELVKMIDSEIEIRKEGDRSPSKNEKSLNALIRRKKDSLLVELRLFAKKKQDDKAQEWAVKKRGDVFGN